VNAVVRTLSAVRPRRFKPYPAYKDSGVEWLGKVPAHWEVKPLKQLTAFTTGWTPPTGREDLYGGEHLWANISDLGPRVLLTTDKTISDAAIRETRLQKVNAGSLLFSFKLSVGMVSIAGVDMFTNEAIAAFAPSPRIATQYLYWAAPALVPRNAQENIYGAPLLNRDRIANARLVSPPTSEQRAIAAFLDRETARIDTLVAKKERVIELLQEKRTALITRAVTKGLDPTVPMKGSGIDWLGEIPAHWEVKRLRYVAGDLGVGVVVNPSQYVTDEGLPFLYGSDVAEGRISTDECRRISAADSKRLPKSQLRHGDLVMVRVGAPGVTAVVPRELDGANCASMLVIRKANKIDSTWLCFALNSQWVRAQVQVVQYGAAQEQFNVGHAVNFLILVPPPREQHTIAAFLDRETARLDALIAKVREAIERLKELRTALISAAVTGKIDVRGEAAA